jgi:hypothetical protein
LLIAETLDAAARVAVAIGKLRGIALPDGHKQQTLFQYANDTSFSLAGVEPNIRTVIQLLH